MRVYNEGFTLTDVPGVDYIKIIPRASTVVIVIKSEGEEPRDWGLDDTDAFQLALERAVSLGRSVEAQNEES